MRHRKGRAHAGGRVPDRLRLHLLRHAIAAQGWRLLRVLFLRLGAMPADPSGTLGRSRHRGLLPRVKAIGFQKNGIDLAAQRNRSMTATSPAGGDARPWSAQCGAFQKTSARRGELRELAAITLKQEVLRIGRRLVIKETAISWSNHRCAMMGAALAYYSVFSFGPLLVISTAIAGLVFGPEAVHGEIAAQVAGLLGPAGAQALATLLAAANHPYQGTVATIFGIAMLLFAAIGVVAQLKEALNIVWDVAPSGNSGILPLIRGYVVSLAGVLALGFLLLVSLIFTAALAAIGKFVAPYFPETALQIVGSAVSFTLITILFAMMFKWLPDTPVDWRDVWLGAALTAALFEIGKFLIAFYVGKQALESAYGAATSLVMLLIWVYYSAQIVLFGAEFTHVYAKRHRAPAPDRLVQIGA
jgi:membrane protein